MRVDFVALAILAGLLWRVHADGTTGFSLIIQNAGVPQGGAVILNCGGNLFCSTANGKVTVSGLASLVLYEYIGAPSGLPACAGPAPGPQIAALAYVTGPPDSVETCMTGPTGNPEWQVLKTAQ